jgi:hypothetical protein
MLVKVPFGLSVLGGFCRYPVISTSGSLLLILCRGGTGLFRCEVVGKGRLAINSTSGEGGSRSIILFGNRGAREALPYTPVGVVDVFI